MQVQHTLQRQTSLDVFRGLTIVLMILVNSPGTRSPYGALQHSLGNGCTLADLVFPFFIVIVGLSCVLSISNQMSKRISKAVLMEKIIKRSGYIFLMGLLLNAFSLHPHLDTLRIMGVLQRIAICYFFSATLFLTTNTRTQLFIMVSLLLGYGLLMSSHTLQEQMHLAYNLDSQIFSPLHMYSSSFEPEGLLSTIPAIASVLLGNLAGIGLITLKTDKQRVKIMLVAGLLLMFGGWLWSFTLPLNKALWSSSYVLWTGGLALLILTILKAIIEIKCWTTWSKPFVLFGRHALLVYMLHVLFLKVQAMIPMHQANGSIMNFRFYITDILFGFLSTQNAALGYAVCYTLLWLIVIKCFDNWKKG